MSVVNVGYSYLVVVQCCGVLVFFFHFHSHAPHLTNYRAGIPNFHKLASAADLKAALGNPNPNPAAAPKSSLVADPAPMATPAAPAATRAASSPSKSPDAAPPSQQAPKRAGTKPVGRAAAVEDVLDDGESSGSDYVATATPPSEEISSAASDPDCPEPESTVVAAKAKKPAVKTDAEESESEEESEDEGETSSESTSSDSTTPSKRKVCCYCICIFNSSPMLRHPAVLSARKSRSLALSHHRQRRSLTW